MFYSFLNIPQCTQLKQYPTSDISAALFSSVSPSLPHGANTSSTCWPPPDLSFLLPARILIPQCMYIIVGYLLLYLSCVQSHHQINIHTDIYTLRLQSRTDIVYATMSLNIPLSSFRCRPHLLGCPECGHFPPFATLDKPTDWIAILHCSNDNCSINPTYYICRFCATKVLPGGRAIVERRYLYRHSRTKQHVKTMTMLSNDETRNILKQPSSDPNPTDHSSVALPVDEEHSSIRQIL